MFGFRKPIVAFAILACAWPALAQSAAPAPAPTDAPAPFPDDPAGYLQRVQDSLLSRAPGAMPFHLKGHFTGAGTKEDTGEGAYELTWMAPDQWRMDVTLGSFALTKVGTAKGTYQIKPDVYEPRAAGEVDEHLFPRLSQPGKNETLEHGDPSAACSPAPAGLV